MTTADQLAAEKTEQARWRLRPRWSAVTGFDRLLENEFLSADEQHARQAEALQNLVRFAVAQVPYYGDLFGRLGLAPDQISTPADLVHLPPLTKPDLREHPLALQARALPPGERLGGETRTSGTTGQPVRVVRSHSSLAMFGFLKQREFRWFRFDPAGSFASIRCPDELPRDRQGRLCAKDVTCRLEAWPLVGEYFATGPFFGCDHTNPVDALVAWIDQHQPNHLLTESGDLENIAFGYQDRAAPASLRGIEAISHLLTPDMRRRAERAFRVPIFQNYGLNEIGIVASQCSAGGRYHVHTEHCLVEIVDDRGQPCRPGETGRILVTGLTNTAMPLIRYDADDLAEVVDGPCPCGRTLPSFGHVTGRYRRTAFLPPKTYGHWQAVRLSLERMPAELAGPLRQYQLHQYRDGTYELRLAATGTFPPEFFERVQHDWQTATAPETIALRLVVLDQIPRGYGRKYQNFTSDFSPVGTA